MKRSNLVFLVTLILSALSCNAATLTPKPTTVTDSVPTNPLVDPFTGTWRGPDPDDGSVIVLSLTQSGNSLTGTFSDTYSGDIQPGYQGNGSGTVDSSTTAQITFNLTRGDGTSITVQFRLTLSNQNNTVVLDSQNGGPITLQR